MQRLSQDGWDAVMHFLQQAHLARLWITGDAHVQLRIVSSRRRRIRLKGERRTDLCMRVLLAGAQEAETDCLPPLDYNGQIFANTLACITLQSLRVRAPRNYQHITGHFETLELTHLRHLQTCRFEGMPFIYKIILPLSVTNVALPITTIIDMGGLKSLVRLQLESRDAGEATRIDLVWPPALATLEFALYDTAECTHDLLNTLPGTLTCLEYTGEPSTPPSLEVAMPPQCRLLERVYFSRVRFGHVDENNVIRPPPTLQSLEVLALRLKNAEAIDRLLDFVPKSTSTFKVGSIRRSNGSDLPSSSVTHLLKLMDRLDAESVEMQVFRYNGALPVLDGTLLQFKQGTQRILVKHGLSHETYFDDLLRTNITTIAEAVQRLPPRLGERLFRVTTRFYGENLKMPGLVNDVSDEGLNSTRYLFSRGAMTGFSIWKICDLPFDSNNALSDPDIARYIERLNVDADDAWFVDLFPSGVCFPRLRRISLERVGNEAAIPTIYAARHNLPLLERVDLSPGSVLNAVAHVKMMAEMRLYGSTKITCYPTMMRYRVSPPVFFARQLKGQFDEPVVVEPIPFGAVQ